MRIAKENYFSGRFQEDLDKLITSMISSASPDSRQSAERPSSRASSTRSKSMVSRIVHFLCRRQIKISSQIKKKSTKIFRKTDFVAQNTDPYKFYTVFVTEIQILQLFHRRSRTFPYFFTNSTSLVVAGCVL